MLALSQTYWGLTLGKRAVQKGNVSFTHSFAAKNCLKAAAALAVFESLASLPA